MERPATAPRFGVLYMVPRAMESLPACFESLIAREPGAPAVVLRRPGCRERIWTRAAVEHRAVRIGALCSNLGLAADARVAVTGRGALDVLAATWFLLATGRALTDAASAQFMLDDAVLARADGLRQPYTLRCAVLEDEPAAFASGRSLTHGELLRAVQRGDAVLEGELLQRCLNALATGEPVEVEAGGLPDARVAVCAA